VENKITQAETASGNLCNLTKL